MKSSGRTAPTAKPATDQSYLDFIAPADCPYRQDLERQIEAIRDQGDFWSMVSDAAWAFDRLAHQA